ncbi:hypothetical protein R0K19_25825, partial [Bacillus sp. SIMBA_161]
MGIYGQSVSGGSTTFTLSAANPEPALDDVVQTEVQSGGQSTLELIGDGFSAGDTVKLVASDNTELL